MKKRSDLTTQVRLEADIGKMQVENQAGITKILVQSESLKNLLLNL